MTVPESWSTVRVSIVVDSANELFFTVPELCKRFEFEVLVLEIPYCGSRTRADKLGDEVESNDSSGDCGC